MVIIHSSKLGFFFHLFVLALIFVLILTSNFIAVKEFGRWGADTVIVLGSLSLIILFAYAMYIGTTYSLIKKKREDDSVPNAHIPILNPSGNNNKGYAPVPPTYNNEADDSV